MQHYKTPHGVPTELPHANSHYKYRMPSSRSFRNRISYEWEQVLGHTDTALL